MSRTATFTVNLTQAHVVDVYVDYATVSDSAKSGQDFTAISGTLHFNPGDVSKTLNVNIDAKSDRSLFFGLKLSKPQNAKLTTRNTGRSEIKADNVLVALVATALAALQDYEAAEAASQAAAAAAATALATYNSSVTAYDAAVTDLNNANAALSTSTTNANNYWNSYNGNLSAYYATGNAAYYSAAQSDLANYGTWNSKKSQDQDWVNRATTTKNNALTAKNNALTAKNTADSAASTAAGTSASKFAIYTPAYATAAAGFVGSTTIQF